MTNRSKTILISAALLALLVAAGLARKLLQTGTARTQAYFYGFIAVLCIASVPLVYWLKIRLQGFEKQLTGAYLEKYEQVLEHIGNASLHGTVKTDLAGDVLEMLLTAQKTGRPADLVLPDTAAFAAELIEARTGHRASRLMSLLSSMIYLVCFILGTQLLLWLEDTYKNLFAIRQSYDILSFYLLLAFVLLPLLKSERVQAKSWRYLLPLGSGILFVLLDSTLRHFGGDVNVIPDQIVLIAMMALIPLLLLARQSLKSRRPANPKAPPRDDGPDKGLS
jgi:DNA-binding ferritin-like protein (Dps family)